MDVDPKKLRAWARLLSTLVQTPNEELDDFARERLDGGEVSVEVLERGRDLLFHLGRALDEPDPERWEGVRVAADSFDHWQAGLERGAGEAEDAQAAVVPEPVIGPEPVVAAVAVPAPRPESAQVASQSPWVSVRDAPAAPAQPASSPPAAPAQPASSPPAAPARPASSPPAAPAQPAAAAQQAPPASERELVPELLATRNMADEPPAEVVLPFKGRALAPIPLDLENPMGGGTVQAAGKKGPTMPFRAAADQRAKSAPCGPPTGFTLERYAAFCTERTMWPDNVEGRRARFQLSDETEVQADAYFERIFDSNPLQRQVWLELCEKHRKKLDEG